jgi:MFS family permease
MTQETTKPADTADKKSSTALTIVVGIATFVTTFDITAVLTIMPRVKEDLALSIGGFAWLMNSYSLAFVVFLMAAGVLADRYGRRRALLAGTLIFLAASLLCVLAKDQPVLLAGRTLQGLGAAFMVCGGLAVLGHRYIDRGERARAFGLLGTINGSAMAFGPAGGGLIAKFLGWHWVFFINIPICLFIIAGSFWVVKESSDPAKPRIDVLGVSTLSLFLISTVWLLLHGTSVGAVEIPLPAALGIVVVLGTLFLLSQRYGARPLLQLGLFSSRAFMGLCLVPLALSVAYWAVLIYLPLFLQERLGSTPDETSYLLLAATLPMFILPMFSARIALAVTTGVFFSTGLIVVGVGGFAIAAGAQLQSLPLSLAGMAVAGAGCAVLNPQMVAKMVGLVPREQAGAVSAISVILRQGGFALGIALLAGVLRALGGSPLSIAPSANPYTIVFVVAAVSALVSAVAVFVLTASRANAQT